MILKNEYFEQMKKILNDEDFGKFLKLYNNSSFRGLRFNSLKCNYKKVMQYLNIDLRKTPFDDSSFYFDYDIKGIGNNPLHNAGAFYIQEPSATSAVKILDPKPFDKVLDLCAAPGGKSTQIAAALKGKGLLWSNEYVRNRTQVLISNIERLGVRNAVVSSCHPNILCSKLSGFFDKVLVDAPCSGEGMFRKDPEAVRYWSMEHVKNCAKRQKEILKSASIAVKEGGSIVYSTCTFSKEENEDIIDEFLRENSNFVLEDIVESFGRPGYNKDYFFDMSKTRRIYPMDGGEGHFIAKLKCIKNQFATNQSSYKCVIDNKNLSLSEELFNEIFNIQPYGLFEKVFDKIMLIPRGLPELSGLGVLRAGVLFGEIKKNRIEPSHALFMAATPNELRQCIDLDVNSNELNSYIRGEEISVPIEMRRFIGVAVNSVMLGFGKSSNGIMKNKYPKGLRMK